MVKLLTQKYTDKELHIINYEILKRSSCQWTILIEKLICFVGQSVSLSLQLQLQLYKLCDEIVFATVELMIKLLRSLVPLHSS